MLQVFTYVTKELSHSGIPTLPFALPMYARMQSHLESFVKDESLSPLIRNALAAGLIKLNEYYDHAKESHYTILATGA